MNPVDPELILCACMYENFSVVGYDRENGFRVEAVLHHGQDKICYGAGWGRKKGQEKSSSYYFATCSFYDKLFSLNRYSAVSM